MGLQIKRIQDYLTNHALDAFLVLTKINRQYLSGFTGSAGLLLIRSNASQPPVKVRGGVGELYVDDRYLIRARRESGLPVKLLDKLPASLFPLRTRRGRGVRLRVGIEDRISLRDFQSLKKTLRGVKFVPTSNIVENLRVVKAPNEIRYIKKAQTIIDKLMTIVMSLSLVGKREIEIAQMLERSAARFGADAMAFEPIVAWGPNAAMPHHLSGTRKIGRQNFLLLDFGVLVNGYHSDFTRTLFIGKPNRKQERIYNIVLEAQGRGIKKMRVGMPAQEVDREIRDFMKSRGFGKYFTHNSGHGVGLEIHEAPNLAEKSPDVLSRNTIVTVEPGIYIEKWSGVRIEDMVVVGKNGTRVLSKSPKDLKGMIV